MKTKKYKVVLVGYSLSGGGLERAMANLSKVLNCNNIDVTLMVLENNISYDYRGEMINYGLEFEKSNSYLNKLKVYQKIKKELNKNYDYIIDCRYRINLCSEFFWSKYIYANKSVVYTVHSAFIDNYIPKNKTIAKFLLKEKKIVCVSKRMSENILKEYSFLKPQTIYNPLDIDEILELKKEAVNFDFEYIIGIGRMDLINVKQLDVLIDTYSNSVLPNNNIHLVLLGEGDRQEEFKKITKNKGLQDKIHFMGFQQNPFKYIFNSKYLVLSSKYEGFGMVIVEALACGIPVVSYDCNFGPNEIIENKKNGILVDNQNKDELIEALNLLYQDKDLYEKCKQNAEPSISKCSFYKVRSQWLSFLGIE